MFPRLLILALLLLIPSCDEGWLEIARGRPGPVKPTTTHWYLTLQGGPFFPAGNTVIGLAANATATVQVPLKNTIPDGLSMGKPRGMLILPDGRLLVALSRQDQSAIFVLGLPNWKGQRAFLDIYAQRSENNPLLSHPYALVHGPDGAVYVTCQNTSTVLRFAGPSVEQFGHPLGNFPKVGPGCVVPPHKDHEHGLKEPRGLAFGPDGLLYVVDRDDASVNAWNMADGKFVRQVATADDGLVKPIQILFGKDGRMFIGDRGAHTVWVAEHPGAPLKHLIEHEPKRAQLPSALALDDNWLYVGDRDAMNVRRVSLENDTPEETIWMSSLPDEPEFLILSGQPDRSDKQLDGSTSDH